MNRHPIALVELALAEQEARNGAAIAAIKSCAADIAEAQKLTEALSARGAKVRPVVDTQAIGAQAMCRITLWLSTTRQEFSEVKRWLLDADIALTRLPTLDIGDMLIYELSLRTQTIRLNVAVHNPRPAPFRFTPSTTPEAA
jgi:hypothetical protein